MIFFISLQYRYKMILIQYFFYLFFFLPYHFFLHRIENRMKPVSTPYDGRRWWDSNLRTPACKPPALIQYLLHLCSVSVVQSISKIFFFFRAELWVRNCRRADLQGREASYLYDNCCICAEHFESSQFMNLAARNKLVWNAVPTL